MFNLLVYY